MIYMIKDIAYSYDIQVVSEETDKIIENENAVHFIDAWCRCYGSTYEGRKQAACHNLSIKQKPPILISERTRDILFPITAVQQMGCIWINHRSIEGLQRNGRFSQIIFRNGNIVSFTIDYRNIRRNIQLCEALLSKLP